MGWIAKLATVGASVSDERVTKSVSNLFLKKPRTREITQQ